MYFFKLIYGFNICFLQRRWGAGADGGVPTENGYLEHLPACFGHAGNSHKHFKKQSPLPICPKPQFDAVFPPIVIIVVSRM